MSIAIPFLVLVAALLGTGLVRRYALHRELLDVPNARSSHTRPTPRGGGVALVLAALGAWCALWLSGALDPSLAAAVVPGGALVALTGFFDDRSSLPSWVRLLVHFLASVWALAWLGGLPRVPLLFGPVDLGWIGHVLGVLYLVWMLNLYNFMDGIDGIAGIEATVVPLVAAAIALLLGLPFPWPLACLAFAALGFLPWNFPRARIFMGDAGSGFLGFSLGVLSIDALASHPGLGWAWLILLGTFVVDATVTLLRRMIRGYRFDEAHRSHAYQYLARRVGRHAPVSVGYGAVVVFWLGPVAWLAARGVLPGLVTLLLGWLPLAYVAVRFHAGAPERQRS
ncbi:MAG: glycosyltransferase family 4 protein [Pseudomonadales bacterium]|jgi:Fuc2NAc and GlcNAc transferase|nr:glycosyltransferase family 4 protein [Pseudomonadales bacterium]